MKALSIKQPWASLIAHGIKDIENRTWKTKFRGRIYIHATAKDLGTLYEFLTEKQMEAVSNHWTAAPPFPHRPLSAIIGEVDIVDCVINHPSIWAEKTPDCILGGCSKCEINGFCPETGNHLQSETGKPIYNWVLANPVLYNKPILNVKGKLSFWETDYQHCEDCMKPFHVDSMVILEDCWTCSNCLDKHFEELKSNK